MFIFRKPVKKWIERQKDNDILSNTAKLAVPNKTSAKEDKETKNFIQQHPVLTTVS